jgi:hypothetical protein
MQPPSPTVEASSPAVPTQAVNVAVRDSRGCGCQLVLVYAALSGTIADVKRLLCLPPHSVCSDASALQLVLKGEDAAVARVLRYLIFV